MLSMRSHTHVAVCYIEIQRYSFIQALALETWSESVNFPPQADPQTPKGRPEAPKRPPRAPKARPETPKGRPETPKRRPKRHPGAPIDAQRRPSDAIFMFGVDTGTPYRQTVRQSGHQEAPRSAQTGNLAVIDERVVNFEADGNIS